MIRPSLFANDHLWLTEIRLLPSEIDWDRGLILRITFQKEGSWVLEKDIPWYRRFTSQRDKKEFTISSFLKLMLGKKDSQGAYSQEEIFPKFSQAWGSKATLVTLGD